MGIDDLPTRLRKFGDKVYSDVKVSELKGARIAVDVSLIAKKQHSRSKTKIPPDEDASCLVAVMDLFQEFHKHSITPVFIFDGTSSTKKIGRANKRPLRYPKTQAALSALGIVAVLSEPDVEAEGVACRLLQVGVVQYVMTADTDVLAFGCNQAVLSNDRRSLRIFDINKVMEAFALTPPQFTAFCILRGTDFAKRATFDGNARAPSYKVLIKMIQECSDSDSVVDILTNLLSPENRQVYFNASVKFDLSKQIFSILTPASTGTVWESTADAGSIHDAFSSLWFSLADSHYTFPQILEIISNTGVTLRIARGRAQKILKIIEMIRRAQQVSKTLTTENGGERVQSSSSQSSNSDTDPQSSG